MPTIIVPPFTPPISRFTPATGALTGPADGDPLLASSVNNAFIQIADRTALSFAGLYGVYGSRLVATSNGTTITINSQAAVRSSSGVLSGTLGSPFNIATVLGSAPVADTWYYVYGADVAGVLTPIISTDPPEATLKYRTGNPDQMLLTLFRTDGSAAVRVYAHYDNVYLYSDPFAVITGAIGGGAVTVPIPDAPPFVKILKIQTLVYNVSTTLNPTYSLNPGGFLGRLVSVGLSPDGTTVVSSAEDFDLPSLFASPTIAYNESGGAVGTFHMDVFLDGFYI